MEERGDRRGLRLSGHYLQEAALAAYHRSYGSPSGSGRQEETMAKGNNSRKKETKKPKKDAKKK